MRVLILCLSLCLCTNALACHKPISISYGPFVSLLIVKKFFGDFHQELEKHTGCKVNFKIQRDFHEFTMGLFRREHTLAILPGPYFNVLKKIGYVAVASQVLLEPRKNYVISLKKSNFTDIQSLQGRKVLVSSPLASSGSYFLQTLTELDILNQVEIEYGNTYDSMMLSVLRKEADAAVMIKEYWHLLDDNLRENQLDVVAVLEANASTEFVIQKERQALSPMVYEALQSSYLKWGKANQTATGSSLLEKLLMDKLKQFEQSGL